MTAEGSCEDEGSGVSYDVVNDADLGEDAHGGSRRLRRQKGSAVEGTITVLEQILVDLAAETATLDRLLDSLSDVDWSRATPAVGWSIHDQISHLAYFDQVAVLAATDTEGFRVAADRLLGYGTDFPDVVAEQHRTMAVEDLRTWFRDGRRRLIEVFSGLDGSRRIPWFGPDMSITSSATARLMETWAHGQDVFDAFQVERPATQRLRHIAHLGVRTFGFSFDLRRLARPDVPVRVCLTSPAGELWEWGPQDADDVVTGSALDFCLVVTQRRHVNDTGLQVVGQAAQEWMRIAQAFAGSPGPGRAPTTRGPQ